MDLIHTCGRQPWPPGSPTSLHFASTITTMAADISTSFYPTPAPSDISIDSELHLLSLDIFGFCIMPLDLILSPDHSGSPPDLHLDACPSIPLHQESHTCDQHLWLLTAFIWHLSPKAKVGCTPVYHNENELPSFLSSAASFRTDQPKTNTPNYREHFTFTRQSLDSNLSSTQTTTT
jgi:hypothetical protein